MEHISTILQRVIVDLGLNTGACSSCDGNDLQDGPVPDDKDRERWIDPEGVFVICPMCEDGWVEGDDWSYLGHGESYCKTIRWECEHCDGSGKYESPDRCEDCGRLEMAYGKGPEMVPDNHRLYDHLS